MSTRSFGLRKMGKCLALIALLSGSPQIFAAVAENLITLNPKAYALGNAVTADYVGIDSLQYNPAALINLKQGFSTEFKVLGAPLAQIVRKTSPRLTPKGRDFTLFYRGYTVRCDSPLRPFSDLGIPSSMSPNPGRDPVTGGLDPSASSLNFDLPGDICFGPELVNPNSIFADDPLDSFSADVDRILPIPIPAPFYLPNIGYKQYDDSRMAFAAQIFSNAPLPTIELDTSILSDLGIQRFTFTPGFAFRVTDKLSVGGALRISKGFIQVGVAFDGQNQLLGFLNASIHDLCETNAGRRDEGAQFLYDQALNCIDLYKTHQARVDDGKARDSGYYPFLPWEPILDIKLSGDTPLTYGWNLGVQWQPLPWLTWGATYRTKEDDTYRLEGDIFWSEGIQAIFGGLQTVPVIGPITDFLLLDGAPSEALTVDLSLPWPAAFSSGVSMQLLEKLKVNIDYRKYFYSIWNTWDATIVASETDAVKLINLILGSSTIGIPAGGEDTSYIAWGLEYQWNKRLAYRMGYESRPFLSQSGSIVPIYEVTLASLGAEYKLTHDQVVDMAFTSLHIDLTGTQGETSVLDDPLSILNLRGASYNQLQLEANIVMFTMAYTHRF